MMEPPTDRHEKWVRVEPGHVIPAGQPYRVEYPEDANASETACEYVSTGESADSSEWDWFVDSSWKPPLVHSCCGQECTSDELASNSSLDLPTEPTWGIVLTPKVGGIEAGRAEVGRYAVLDGMLTRTNRDFETRYDTFDIDWVLDFIPLTDEQVARIEATR